MENNTQTIYESISIQAAREIVWKILFDDNCTRVWYAEFSEGAYAKTDWSVGSKAIFTDQSHSGLIGEIITNKPAEEMIIEYKGVLTDGKEVYNNAEANAVKGGKEKYFLTGDQAQTNLSIECDMSKELFEYMSAAWKKALLKIKELAEAHI